MCAKEQYELAYTLIRRENSSYANYEASCARIIALGMIPPHIIGNAALSYFNRWTCDSYLTMHSTRRHMIHEARFKDSLDFNGIPF